MTTVLIRKEWAGRVVDGKFPLLRWLGGCESCGVFLTERQGPDAQSAAIKLMPAEVADTENRAAGWEAARRLDHPRLLRLYEFGRCRMDGAEFAYVVTEFGDEVLADVLQERALTPEETGEMLGPLLEALEYLHGLGFVHGRLRPSKIMAVDDQLKLSMDHLLWAGASGAVSDAGPYDALELASGKVSPAADVWSLGVTLVEALTQNRPEWDRKANGEPVVPEGMPEPFAGIAQGCLRVDPAKRLTLREIQARLKPELALEGTSAVEAQPDHAAFEPKRRAEKAVSMAFRMKLLIAAVAVVIVLIGLRALWEHRGRVNSQGTSEPPARAVTPAPAPQAKVAEPVAAKPVIVKGAVVRRVPAEVLTSALETIRGTLLVDVRVTVGPDGNVSKAVFDRHGPSRYFANAAMQAAMQWKFRPAQVNGQAVESVWLLEFVFRQTTNDVTAEAVSP